MIWIRRRDGVIQRYRTTPKRLHVRGYVGLRTVVKGRVRTVYFPAPEIPEEIVVMEPEPIAIVEPQPEDFYEVVVYTEYKEKKKDRHDRYELRTVVKASSRQEALERGLGKFGDVVPDDYLQYLDHVGIFAVEAREAVRRISPRQEYDGVKYFRFDVDASRPLKENHRWRK